MPKVGDKKAKWEQRDDIRVCVQGLVHGGVAVHQGLGPVNVDQFTVTQLSTGYVLCTVKLQLDAKLIAEVFWRDCRKAMQLSTAKETLSALPRWVRPWIMECRRKGKYVDPASFKNC